MQALHHERGSISIFIETLVVILVILGFLIAIKLQSNDLKNQEIARSAYPGGQSSILMTRPGRTVSESEEVAPITERTQPYVITYTDAGFSPDILIMNGLYRVVMFRNESSQKMWIAADKHPYFNQGRGVGSGEAFWYAFPASAESYTYRNQLRPGHQGIIIVQ